MAIRYLAIIENQRASDAAEHARIEVQTGLYFLGNVAGVALYATDPYDCVDCQAGTGIIIGHLFSRSTRGSRVTWLKDELTSRIVETRGQSLLKDFWGGYVAIMCDRTAGTITVLRDPSGTMPCYYLASADRTVICSDVETLVLSGFLKPDIDWPFLAHHLYCQDLRNPRTGLKDLKELMAGFKMTIAAPGPVVSMAWSPWDFVPPTTLHASELQDTLRQTVQHCTRTWASCFRHLLVPVSGGLDSSILASCLSGQPTEWDCLNMTTDEPEGDERIYARALTAHLDKPLIEAFHDMTDIDITRTSSGHLPRPIGFAFGQSEERIKRDLASRRRSEAYFTGQGGDNVFCFMQSATPFLDRFIVEGPGTGTWTTLNDICALTGCSLFEAIRMAFQRCRTGPTYLWRGDMNFLDPDAVQAGGTDLTHPWLEAPDKALPGKAVHIAMLLRIQGTLEGWSRQLWGPLITPLLSQPVVELCLSIPTWKWCEGGMNRSVARHAFETMLPPALIERRSKGGPNSVCLDVIEIHRKLLREFLLGGLLAQNKLVDSVSLQRLFDSDGPIGPPYHLRLSALAECEAWARHW